MNKKEELEIYVQKKMRARKPWYGVKIGIQRIIYNPVYILGLIALAILFIKTWQYKYVFQIDVLTGVVADIYGKVVEEAFILVFIMLMLLYISKLGEQLVRDYEVAPVVEFSAEELRPGHPILTSYKKDRRTKVEELIYFTLIDKKIWDNHQNAIARKLKSRCVQDTEYGGKYKDNSNYMIMYIKKGSVPREGGEALDKDV